MNYISNNNATSAFTQCSIPSNYNWNENGGIVILSKIQGNLVINEEIIQPIGEGRSVIGFQIDDDNYTLFDNSVILCTHLSTVYVNPNETTVFIDNNGTAVFTTSTELIQNQVEEIISTLDDYNNYNQFIMGDFNSGPDEVPDAYYIAIDEGYKNVFEYNSEFESLWECTYCGKYPDYIYDNELSGNQTSKLDHILYKRGNKKNNIQVRNVEIEFRQDEIDVETEDGDDNSIPLSDHYGVYAEFVINNKKNKRWIYHYWTRSSSSSSE
jgi:endonuclease/exonuclease/phosphatase family metal-dependent hydrolase